MQQFDDRRRQELGCLPKEELVRRLLAAEAKQASLGALNPPSKRVKLADPAETMGTGAKQSKHRAKHKQRRNKGQFDFSKHRQRHIALKVLYFGQGYHGFAAQADSDNTVEAHLFRALERTCLIEDRVSCNYSRCGRTDKGVSAFGQVIALYVRSKLRDGNILLPHGYVKEKRANETPPPRVGLTANVETAAETADAELDYIKMLNGVLPSTIRVLGWAHIPPTVPEWSARFSCTGRVYHYYFVAHPGLQLDAMREAARFFEGEHDFRSFCKMDIEHVTHFNRHITSFTIVQENDVCAEGKRLCYFRIEGSAFLWHQVRCMVAVLMMVGEGKESSQVVAKLLNIEQTPVKPQYKMAADGPLILFDCLFENLQFYTPPAALMQAQQAIWDIWEGQAIQSAVASSALGLLLADGIPHLPQGQTKRDNQAPWSRGVKHIPLENRAKEGMCDSLLVL